MCPDLKHMLALKAAGNLIFRRLYCDFCCPCSCYQTGARSVTSWAKFISKSSFVDPAQTIKGAAGMTSAWKIPHMERWKMTWGFLSTEASSAIWQWKRREKKPHSSISGLLFVYTVICQSYENTGEIILLTHSEINAFVEISTCRIATETYHRK